MHVFQVGQPYNPSVKAWPEGVHVGGLSEQRMEILVAFARPTSAEVQAFRDTSNVVEVGLASHGSLVLFLAKIPGVFDWADCPYDARLMPPSQQGLPTIGHTLIQWIFVDAATGIILGLRASTVTPQFTMRLRELLERQAATPFNRTRYDADIDGYQQRFSTEALVRRAWIVEQTGVTAPVSGPMREAQADIVDTLDLNTLISDDRIREVVTEAIGRGEAHLDERGDETWYVDPGFGPDVPLRLLGYDEDLGLVDRRRFPENPEA